MTGDLTLCAGHVIRDEVVHADRVPDPDRASVVDEHRVGCGGSAANTALGVASFGRDAAVLSSVGDDAHGDELVETLADHGVRPHVSRAESPTTVIQALVTPEDDPRYFARNLESPDIPVDGIDADLWEDVGHVHVTNFDPERAGKLAKRASEAGRTVSFNPTQGYGDEPCPEIVEAADVITLNDREADLLRERHDFDALTEDTTVVVTHGPDGSTAHTPDGVHEHEGFGVEGVRDTIGAGDAFAAGFVDAWLDDVSPEAALAQANAAGAYAVTRTGAPDRLDAEQIRTVAERSDVDLDADSEDRIVDVLDEKRASDGERDAGRESRGA